MPHNTPRHANTDNHSTRGQNHTTRPNKNTTHATRTPHPTENPNPERAPMTPTLTTKTPDHPTMTHFTQNTLATTTQTLTIKTGRTQIRSNNLPTQTPGGHHTQITPHPKRPSETHTPNKKIHPQPVPPHTLYPCPQKVAPPNTPRPSPLPKDSIH